MLLGQAESGKSTLQKQFQLYYASQSLEKERPAWRPIVHFNIVKAVRMILEELEYQLTSTSPIDESPTGSPLSTPTPSGTGTLGFGFEALKRPPLPQPPLQHMSSIARGKLPAVPPPLVSPNGTLAAGSSYNINGNGSSHNVGASGSGAGGSSSATKASLGFGTGWQDDLAALRTKLLPLVAVEESLARDLSGGVSVTAPGAGGRAGVFVRAGWQALSNAGRSLRANGEESPSSPTATSGTGGGPNGTSDSYSNTFTANHNVNGANQVNDLVARMLAAACEEIEVLWKHPNVRALVKHRKLRLEESASFFLENIERISQPGYLPTTEDILKVRLQTLGVKEHSFDINLGGTRVNWLLYDVGGARGQRHAWVPYFDDATAIIFLAPISAFDQYLEEDPRTNRIDDSLQLFTVICSNKLLKNTHLVLLLNKTDLLRQKLDVGTKVRKYITSYGDRPNRFEEVSEYFRAHFLQVHRRNDISKRALYAHFTSMLDIKATQKIIVNVGEAIIRSYITDAGLT